MHLLSDVPKSEILLESSAAAEFNKLGSFPKQCQLVDIDRDGLNKSDHSFDVPPPSLGVSRDSSGFYILSNRFLENGRILAVNLFANLKLGIAFGIILS